MNTDKYLIESYSEEELVAQIGACFLNSFTGSEMITFENDVAYIEGWSKRLKRDKRFIIFANSKAQRAVDYILNMDIDAAENIAS